MTLLQSFLVACYYWFAWWDFGMVGNITTNCTFIGFIFGLAFGDIKTGIIIGATINSMYLSTVAAGGNLPNDPALACCVAIPIALKSGLDVNAAVALSIPFALLGTFLDNIRRTVNGVWNRRALKHVSELNFKGIKFDAIFGPIIVQFFVRVPVVTAVVYLLGRGADSIMSMIPAWLTTTFGTIGGVLPGLGMVLCATMIGRTELIPFFIVGYFLFKVSGWSLVVMAIFAAMTAIIYIQCRYPAKPVADDDDDESEETDKAEVHTGVLDKKMRTRTAMRVLFFHRFANSMENQFGTSLCNALMPALRVIYKDNDEGLKEALKRHLQPYISEMTWGNCIMGASLAMEEQKASGGPVKGEDISALKSGLMGPFAGFGDSFNWATVAPLIRGMFLPLGMSGNILGILMEPVVRIYAVVLGNITFNLGYSKGRSSLTGMLRGGWFEKAMTGVGAMGMFMLGVMGCRYTSVSTSVVFHLATGDFVLNDMLNSIVPGLLSFATLMASYVYLKKGGKFIRLLLIVVATALVGSIIGFF